MMLDKSFIEDTLTNSRNLVVMKRHERSFLFVEHHFGISAYDMTVDINIYQMAEYLVFQNLQVIADLVSKEIAIAERITQDILYIIKKSNKFYHYIPFVLKGCHSCVAAHWNQKEKFSSN